MSASLAELIDAARERPPLAAVVLGSGMGELADVVRTPSIVPFADIPDLAGTTVHGHRGQLLLGDWAGRRVLVFAGRLHYYEGHPWERVVAPVHLAHRLGARILVLTNAAGGIRSDLKAGDLVGLHEHVSWTRPYWWRYPGPGGLGPPRDSPYSSRLLDLLIAAARAEGLELPVGVYGQVTGPTYETPAEIRALRACGVDVVGMSTGREIEAGRDLGLECAALSCVCNQAAGLGSEPIDHQDVLRIAARMRDRLTATIERFLAMLPVPRPA